MRNSEARRTLTARQLRDILGRTTNGNSPGRQGQSFKEIQHWLTRIEGYAGKQAEEIVRAETNWDAKRYSWISMYRKSPCQRHDKLILFHFPAKSVCLVEVKQNIKSSRRTPDGSYFVAYKRVRGYTKRLTSKLWTTLREEGVTQKSIKARDRRIGKRKADRLKALLRSRRK